MQEIDKRIALLRLLIADIDSREGQRAALVRQYSLQRRRIVEATVQQAGDLGQALQALREVEERLSEAEQSGKHLVMLRTRAATELEALLLTRRVAEAKLQLRDLECRQQELEGQLAAYGESEPLTTSGLLLPRELPPDPTLANIEAGQEELELRELNEQVQSEIARLHRLIADASQRAARNISQRELEQTGNG